MLCGGTIAAGVGGELFVADVVVVVVVLSEGCVLFTSRCRECWGLQYGGRYRCGGYLPHILNCSFMGFALDVRCNTTHSKLHAMISIVRLVRSTRGHL
jgi:hypothetical protein